RGSRPRRGIRRPHPPRRRRPRAPGRRPARAGRRPAGSRSRRGAGCGSARHAACRGLPGPGRLRQTDQRRQAMTAPPAEATAEKRNPVLAVVRRLPGTIAFIVVILIVGVVSGALWTPFADSPAWETFAYGLPALEAGRWWTPITGTFFQGHPWVYPIVAVAMLGMVFLEYKRGWRVMFAYFWVGQLFAVLGAALIFWA